MPFLDHLEELRRRLFSCAIALAVGGIIAWALFVIVPNYVHGWNPIEFLQQPAQRYLNGHKLAVTAPGEYFQIMLDVGFWIAFVIASPVIIFQLWGFVSPAMYEHERRIAVPVVIGIALLFVLGAIMAFFLILPLTLQFFFGLIDTTIVDPVISISRYFELMTYMCLGFGALFELPIVMMGLTAIGIVNPVFLGKYRRYAAVAGLLAGGFITPDPTAMFVIAIPVYLLFELSLVLSRLVLRAKERRKAKEEKDDTEPPSGGSPPRGLPPGGAGGSGREPRRLGAPA